MKRSILTLSIIIPVLAFGIDAVGTSLHDAIASNDLGMVAETLVTDSALINEVDEAGLTPLRLAVRNQQLEIIEVLLTQGAQDTTVLPRFGMLTDDAFGQALMKKDGLAVLELLLDRGWAFDVERVNSRGYSRLEVAIRFGNTGMVNLLVRHGANVNKMSPKSGSTPLIMAARMNRKELVPILLDLGADPSIADEAGDTPLRFVVDRGQNKIAEQLLAQGASMAFRDNLNGHTYLHLAAVRGYRAMAEVLINSNHPINPEDNTGKTPLYYATRYGHEAMADYLVSKEGRGADKANTHHNASHWVREIPEGSEAVAWYLNNRGWAIKTRRNILVFDAEEHGVLRSDNPSLANGFLTFEELKDQEVSVFYSCYHGYPGEPAYVHLLADSLEQINFVHLVDDQWRGSPNTIYLESYADTSVENITIRTIDLLEDMPTLGYLVGVDGLIFYYQAFGSDDRERMAKDFGYLSDVVDTIDIAFLPLPEPGTAEESDLKHFLDRFPVRLVCLLDPNRRESLFPVIVEEMNELGYEGTFFCAEYPGDFVVLTRKD